MVLWVSRQCISTNKGGVLHHNMVEMHHLAKKQQLRQQRFVLSSLSVRLETCVKAPNTVQSKSSNFAKSIANHFKDDTAFL